MATNDKYRRDLLDGGITWGTAYQFRGTDGSDASIPSYIHRTYISETEIRSPTIYGCEIYGGIGSNRKIIFYTAFGDGVWVNNNGTLEAVLTTGSEIHAVFA